MTHGRNTFLSPAKGTCSLQNTHLTLKNKEKLAITLGGHTFNMHCSISAKSICTFVQTSHIKNLENVKILKLHVLIYYNTVLFKIETISY
jgi:hypothetical protein